MFARTTQRSRLHPLRFFVAYQVRAKSDVSPSPEVGLTLIECLVAIVIISLTVIAITPPVFLATASRIQSRRAEQANQIAQAEIDRVRTLVERGLYTTNQIPGSIGANSDIDEYVAPGGVNGNNLLLSPATCTGFTKYPQPNTIASPGELIPVDIDGDCVAEYAMQVFRSEGCIPTALQTTTTQPFSFNMGVRVYNYIPGEALPVLERDRATLALTTGRRDVINPGGGTSRRPLQTIYTKMTRSNTVEAMECAAQ